MIEMTFKVGRTLVKVSENSYNEVMKWQFLGQIPSCCTECKSTDIALTMREPGGNKYFGVKCLACGSELTLHQYKAGGLYLTAEDKFKKFQRGDEQETQAAFNDGRNPDYGSSRSTAKKVDLF